MTEADEQGQGREGALGAMLEVIEDEGMARLYQAAVLSFDREDYETIVDLAWRYQFDDDRTKFKRGINELEAHVSRRIEARLELSE